MMPIASKCELPGGFADHGQHGFGEAIKDLHVQVLRRDLLQHRERHGEERVAGQSCQAKAGCNDPAFRPGATLRRRQSAGWRSSLTGVAKTPRRTLATRAGRASWSTRTYSRQAVRLVKPGLFANPAAPPMDGRRLEDLSGDGVQEVGGDIGEQATVLGGGCEAVGTRFGRAAGAETGSGRTLANPNGGPRVHARSAAGQTRPVPARQRWG